MKAVLKTLVVVGVAAMVAMPFVWLLSQGALAVTTDSTATASDRLYPFVRLLGLLVFTGLTLQILSQTFWVPLTKLFAPKSLLAWHIAEGLVVYSLVLLHPFMFDLTQYLATHSLSFLAGYVPHAGMDRFEFLVMLGYFNLILITLTVSAGLLRKRPFIRRWWKKVHVLNYLVFGIALYHSLNIGTDTQSGLIHALWILYAGLVGGGIVFRLGELYVKHQRVRGPKV